MERIQIKISDFNLFYEAMLSTSKIVEAAKFQLSENGLEIYGTRDLIARCAMTTNSIYADCKTEFMLDNIPSFVKLLNTVKDIHGKDFSELKLYFDKPFLKFESNKIKTKLGTCNDSERIEKWISKKIEAKMNSIFQFKTTSEYISRINKHTFMFSDIASVRAYLSLNPEMENNAIFATLGNKENNLNNELTFKFGIATKGKLEDGKSIILDLSRINLLNTVKVSEISVSLMDIGVLLCETNVLGNNSSFFNMKIYTSPLKK